MPIRLIVLIITISCASQGLAADFPTGKLKGIGFLVEKGNMKITDKDLHAYSSSATIEKQSENAYAFTIAAILQNSPSAPRKTEKKVDVFDVIWESSNSGKLINKDSSYKDDNTIFAIDDQILTIKSWIARNHLWETQYYSLEN